MGKTCFRREKRWLQCCDHLLWLVRVREGDRSKQRLQLEEGDGPKQMHITRWHSSKGKGERGHLRALEVERINVLITSFQLSILNYTIKTHPRSVELYGSSTDEGTIPKHTWQQQFRGRIFFSHKQLTNRAAADELFQITVVYLKFWAEVKGWCAGLHRWSFSFRRWKQGKLQASNGRLAVRWRGACIWTADSRADWMSLLVKCIKTQDMSKLSDSLFSLFLSLCGTGPHPHGCLVSQLGLMAVTVECLIQLLQDEIPVHLAGDGSKNLPASWLIISWWNLKSSVISET